jgi:hypothetical protein
MTLSISQHASAINHNFTREKETKRKKKKGL